MKVDKEISQLISASLSGNFNILADSSDLTGIYAKLIEGLNDLTSAFKSPINEANQVLAQLATGDLTTRMLNDYQGDFNSLKMNINGLGMSFTKLINQIIESVTETSAASLEITTNAEQLAASSHEQSAQAEEVASAVEEMARTVTDNAQSATKTALVAKENATVAIEGGKVVHQTVAKMNQIANVVEESALNIEKLGESSKAIGEIISVIDDIADQTNLLALNAAIEAARAGEQGRGFAVVADEVRKLAERTTEATKQIAEMIKGIQSDTQSAVVAMHQGNKEVREGIDLADKAGKSLKEILNSSNQVNDLINQIAAASEEQSATTEEIARNVISISMATVESSQKVEAVANFAENLAKLTGNLKSLVEQFTVDATIIKRLN